MRRTGTKYLEVTYRRGKPLAAYLYLPRMENARVARSKKVSPGLVVDFDAEGQPVGIEIVSPSVVTLEALNQVLRDLRQKQLDKSEAAPLLAG